MKRALAALRSSTGKKSELAVMPKLSNHARTSAVALPTATGRPCRRWYIALQVLDSTPSTCNSGRSALAAVAMPAISPPPPIGTTSTSRFGACSSISMPNVPCPAITAASSNGCTSVR
ncbi:hypothetical protein D3C83_38720 [compost metagenome]